jgi:hypothetical protein
MKDLGTSGNAPLVEVSDDPPCRFYWLLAVRTLPNLVELL